MMGLQLLAVLFACIATARAVAWPQKEWRKVSDVRVNQRLSLYQVK
jgi:hypothetical protein